MIRTLAALVLCACLALPAVASAETPAECMARKREQLKAGDWVTLDCGWEPPGWETWRQHVKNTQPTNQTTPGQRARPSGPSGTRATG